MRIFLVRHAHAGWAMPGVRDFDRSLDSQGVLEAGRLAAALTVNGYTVSRIICSNARRCRETLEIVREKTGLSGEIDHTDNLYTGTFETYLEMIGDNQAAGLESLMLVGHNPMLEDAAHALLKKDAGSVEEALGRGFPTAGLLILDIDPGFTVETAGNAHLVGMISPQDA